MESKTSLVVRYQETDQMGIVHHSVYPIWFEAARTDFIAQAGLHYRDMEQAGVWLPLKSLSCQFIHGAKYEDVVTVTTSITNLTPARLEFAYRVENQDGVLLVTGATLHGFTTPQLKPISLKKHFPQFWEVIEKAAGLHLGEV